MKITAKTSEEFEAQLEQFLKLPECASTKGIIYFLRVEKPIPRKVGDSDILYIGKSINSLNDRYMKSGAFNIEMGYFEKYYKKAIEKYGGMYFEVKKSDNPKSSEDEQLEIFRNKHGELPPINCDYNRPGRYAAIE